MKKQQNDAALNAALEPAKQGYACFPVRLVHLSTGEVKKVPTAPHGFKDAATKPDILRTTWRDHPGPLVGIATGAISGINVLDIDQRPEARAWWAQHRDRLPVTRTHRTRSGGLHLIFRHAEGLRCSNSRIAIGVDVKGDGGCCTWWPCINLPVLRDALVAPWPSWLLSQAYPPPPPMRSVAVVSDGKLLRGILSVVARAVEGERNRALFWAACRFAESTLARDDATLLLINAALQIGLPIAEARATINSAYRCQRGV